MPWLFCTRFNKSERCSPIVKPIGFATSGTCVRDRAFEKWASAMKKLVIGTLTILALAIFQTAVVARMLPKDIAARIEAIPIQTLTISDQQFLMGDASGRPTTIAGTLRVARGSGQLPLVILMHGSGGIEANSDLWRREFESLGISTFALDSFTGRGIANTVVDQSQLGRLNMILDLYRSLAALAAHPLIDPSRIAVMGFSRGGQAALYGTLKRFHKLWNPSGIDPAAYIALYPPCITTYIGDTEVTDHPIRIFHGLLDDYVEIAPYRAYVERLKQAAKHVQMIEYPERLIIPGFNLLPLSSGMHRRHIAC